MLLLLSGHSLGISPIPSVQFNIYFLKFHFSSLQIITAFLNRGLWLIQMEQQKNKVHRKKICLYTVHFLIMHAANRIKTPTLLLTHRAFVTVFLMFDFLGLTFMCITVISDSAFLHSPLWQLNMCRIAEACCARERRCSTLWDMF